MKRIIPQEGRSSWGEIGGAICCLTGIEPVQGGWPATDVPQVADSDGRERVATSTTSACQAASTAMDLRERTAMNPHGMKVVALVEHPRASTLI